MDKKAKKKRFGIAEGQLSYAMLRSLGRGLLNRVPKPVKHFLGQHGDETMIAIRVCRTPVAGAIQKIINMITLGSLSEAMKELNYEDLYHLYCVVTLKGGRMFRVEKNARVTITEVRGLEGDCRLVWGERDMTVGQLFANAVAGGLVWEYSAHNNNCQKFVKQLLSPSMTLSENHLRFIEQDAETLLKSVGARGVIKGVTDIGAIVDTVYRGGRGEDLHLLAFDKGYL